VAAGWHTEDGQKTKWWLEWPEFAKEWALPIEPIESPQRVYAPLHTTGHDDGLING